MYVVFWLVFGFVELYNLLGNIGMLQGELL